MMSPTLMSAIGTWPATTTSPGLIPGDIDPVSMVVVWWPIRRGPMASSRNAATAMTARTVVTQDPILRMVLRAGRVPDGAACTVMLLTRKAPFIRCAAAQADPAGRGLLGGGRALGGVELEADGGGQALEGVVGLLG